MLLYILVLLLGSSLSAHAEGHGGWSGGGGEIVGDIHNPWFSESKKVVFYCVDVDGASFSTPASTARQLVAKAIHQWTKIFRDYQADHPLNQVKIATQEWIEVSCNQEVEVQFKLGWDTLSRDQQAFLNREDDARKYIGLAVRTDYNRESLNARGFVYIASDQGSHSFQTREGQFEQPWQYPSITYQVISHELGHVFGLQHSEQNYFTNLNRLLMTEAYPEMVIQAWVQGHPSRKIEDVCEISYYFAPHSFKACDLDARQKQILNLPISSACIRVDLHHSNSMPSRISYYSVNSKGVPTSAVQSIGSNQMVNLTIGSEVNMFITPEQKIFPPQKQKVSSLSGPGGEYWDSLATLKVGSAREAGRSVMALYRDDSFKLLTEIGGQISQLISASPLEDCTLFYSN